MNTITTETRREAHASVNKATDELLILAALEKCPDGATAHELLAVIGWAAEDINSVRPRLTEMSKEQEPRVVVVGKRPSGKAFKMCAVYALPKPGELPLNFGKA